MGSPSSFCRVLRCRAFYCLPREKMYNVVSIFSGQIGQVEHKPLPPFVVLRVLSVSSPKQQSLGSISQSPIPATIFWGGVSRAQHSHICPLLPQRDSRPTQATCTLSPLLALKWAFRSAVGHTSAQELLLVLRRTWRVQHDMWVRACSRQPRLFL